MANGWKLSIFQRSLRPTVCRDSFAFIFQLAKKMKIPVLIDDGFVNFDRERLSIMLELMEELSRVTQVFTLQRKFRFSYLKRMY